jgi:serine/threonine-protein kinase
MALVYRARDTRLECERAVKVLKPELDDVARERFFNEARTMAKLHHKNVVLVHDVADDGVNAYLVMELIEGGSVADRMAAYGPLPQRMACEVAIALLDGLGAAHAAGIVHRDVKPHNILVDRQGTPKVTDFGIAQASEHTTTRTGAVIGTWAYMAPEQRNDAKNVDRRADLFAVGCTLYNMLTGVDPFDLYNREIYDKLYADVPDAFHAVIQRATRYSPEDRYAEAGEMAQDLRALLPELPPDPVGTPPLGVSLEGERAAIVPTIMADHVHSASTIKPAARPLSTPTAGDEVTSWRTWVPMIGMAVVGFVCIGIGVAVFVVSGFFFATQQDAPAEPMEVAATFAPPVPDLAVGDTREPEREEVAPAEEPVPAGPEADVEEPRPQVRTADGYPVTIRANPPGTRIFVDGTSYVGRFSGTLSAGQHRVEYSNTKAKTKKKAYSFPVQSAMNLCWDLDTDGPCGL